MYYQFNPEHQLKGMNGIIRLIAIRVAHFLVENQETGKEGPGNFLQEIAVFLEISWF